MSINYHQPFDYHIRLASEIKNLRKKGVLVIGSGNLTHNLQQVNFSNINASPVDWAMEFDEYIQHAVENYNIDALTGIEKTGTLFKVAHPEPSHYLPLLYTVGLSNKNEPVTYPYEGFQYGTLSMRCIQIG
jgi:4,5-DOPA dioxygenase extradiol